MESFTIRVPVSSYVIRPDICLQGSLLDNWILSFIHAINAVRIASNHS